MVSKFHWQNYAESLKKHYMYDYSHWVSCENGSYIRYNQILKSFVSINSQVTYPHKFSKLHRVLSTLTLWFGTKLLASMDINNPNSGLYANRSKFPEEKLTVEWDLFVFINWSILCSKSLCIVLFCVSMTILVWIKLFEAIMPNNLLKVIQKNSIWNQNI